MAYDGIRVTEIFHSLQGETSLTGVPFVFIRLTGCNLRCSYCDTSYSFKGGTSRSLYSILEEVARYSVSHVLVTGGEPLLQRNTPLLLERLLEEGYQVSFETHGEVSLEKLQPLLQFDQINSRNQGATSSNPSSKLKIIMDIKTPSSGMCRKGFFQNLPLLSANDEVKFVLASEEDYKWAKGIYTENLKDQFQGEVLFSPALPAQNTPGAYSPPAPQWVADRILEDGLAVRFQLQLHKQLWGDAPAK